MQQWHETVGTRLEAERAEKMDLPYPLVLTVVESKRESERDPEKTPEERQFAYLCAEFVLGLRELSLNPFNPAEQILTLEEFWQINAEAWQKMIALQAEISAARSAQIAIEGTRLESKPIAAPGSAEAQRRSLRASLAAERDAIEELPPEERSAALERESDFFRERAEILQQLQNEPVASRP